MLIPFTQLFKRHNIKNVTQVLHVGANEGQEADEYAKLGITKVVWVEAHRPTFLKLVSHLRKTVFAIDDPIGDDTVMITVAGCGRVHVCLNACVSDKEDQLVKFNVANNGCQSSSILEFGTHAKEHPTVKFTEQIEMRTHRLDRLLHEYGIEFEGNALLNMDLQGAEGLALAGLGSELDRFDHAYIEVNSKELYIGCMLVGELDEWFKNRGLVAKEVHMTGSGWGDKLYQRWK
jgi:FkbM family methyltransferase